MSVGEFALIDAIRRRAAGRTELRLGIGDDCSALVIPAGHELLTSTDLLLEEIHFRLDWTDLRSLGLKSVAVNLSDIAAMGGTPLALYLGIGLPVSFSDGQIESLLHGVFDGLEKYDLVLAGGDTCRSSGPLMISVTVQGTAPNLSAITRSGASSGDDLWVSGALGDSALALQELQRGRALTGVLAERHFRPEARVRLGQELLAKQLATAMLDLSDGLCGDLGHILKASQVGARIELGKLPLSDEFRAALATDEASLDLALCGGEDYELLFSARPEDRHRIDSISKELQLPLCRIGEITDGAALKLCLADGQEYRPQRAAFEHFRATKD